MLHFGIEFMEIIEYGNTAIWKNDFKITKLAVFTDVKLK